MFVHIDWRTSLGTLQRFRRGPANLPHHFVHATPQALDANARKRCRRYELACSRLHSRRLSRGAAVSVLSILGDHADDRLPCMTQESMDFQDIYIILPCFLSTKGRAVDCQ